MAVIVKKNVVGFDFMILNWKPLYMYPVAWNFSRSSLILQIAEFFLCFVVFVCFWFVFLEQKNFANNCWSQTLSMGANLSGLLNDVSGIWLAKFFVVLVHASGNSRLPKVWFCTGRNTPSQPFVLQYFSLQLQHSKWSLRSLGKYENNCRWPAISYPNKQTNNLL